MPVPPPPERRRRPHGGGVGAARGLRAPAGGARGGPGPRLQHRGARQGSHRHGSGEIKGGREGRTKAAGQVGEGSPGAGWGAARWRGDNGRGEPRAVPARPVLSHLGWQELKERATPAETWPPAPVPSLRARVTFQPPAAHRGWVLPWPEERLPGGVCFAEIRLKGFGCARCWGASGHPSPAVKAQLCNRN